MDRVYEERLAAFHEKDSWQRHPSQTWRCTQYDGSNLERYREEKGQCWGAVGVGGGGLEEGGGGDNTLLNCRFL